MSFRSLAPVIVAVAALATAWVQRGNAQFYMDSGDYSDDYIVMLEEKIAKDCDCE